MSAARHLRLLAYSFLTWLAFYLIGLPHYYQHWPLWAKLVILPSVTALYLPVTSLTLRKFWSDGQHFRNSLWLAFYLTVPLFVYDYLLLAIGWGLGICFVIPFWYLTFFYFSFWIQIPLLGWMLQKNRSPANERDR
jgi:hypothetical protein